MTDFIIPKEETAIALSCKRDVNLTMPWFSECSRHSPRAVNVLQPLINGERAFAAVHDAVESAKHSIDLIAWGFDPSMRLKRPSGERVGDLLKRKAKSGVKVRLLVQRRGQSGREQHHWRWLARQRWRLVWRRVRSWLDWCRQRLGNG